MSASYSESRIRDLTHSVERSSGFHLRAQYGAHRGASPLEDIVSTTVVRTPGARRFTVSELLTEEPQSKCSYPHVTTSKVVQLQEKISSQEVTIWNCGPFVPPTTHTFVLDTHPCRTDHISGIRDYPIRDSGLRDQDHVRIG